MIRTKMKKSIILMGALASLSFGTGSIVPVKAAEITPRSTAQITERSWACKTCGTKVIASTERKIVNWKQVSKCYDIYHGPDCWVCTVTYADVHTITCPGCNTSSEQNTDNFEDVPGYHLTIHGK